MIPVLKITNHINSRTMKELSIKIPEPCHEDWSQMTPVEQGRHCMSCQKTVVDFTPMSKHRIAEYMKSHVGALCGRFYKDQLEVNLLPAKKNKWYAKYAALLIGLMPMTTFGQSVEEKTELSIVKGKRVMDLIPDKIIESQPIETQEVKNITLDAVEIVAYKVPVVKGYIAGSVAVIHSEPESWLKRTWKELKMIVGVSYKEAQKVSTENRAKRESQNEYSEEEFRFESIVKGIPIHPAPYIKISPNPNQGIFSIRLPEDVDSGIIQILSSTNELLYSQQVNGHNHEVDISQYAAGTYIASFIVGGELLVSEVFVKI